MYILFLFFKNPTIVLGYFRTKKNVKTNIKLVDSIFIFPFFHIGGAEKVHYRVSQVAKASGLNPLFVFTGQSASTVYESKFKQLGTTINIGFRYDNKTINELLLKYFADTINAAKLKVVFSSNSSFFYEMLKYINAVKLIDLVHTYNPPYEVKNVAFHTVFSKLNQRVFINSHSLNNMMTYYKTNLGNLKTDNLKLIYNAPFDEKTEPSYATEKQLRAPFQVVFVSRNSTEKRPQIAFEVALSLSQKHPGKFSFKMIGDFESFKKNDMSNDIEFICNLKDSEEIIPYYKKAHCIILTSETEGFPLVLSEAMFYNVVPITTNVGGIKDVINHQNNGILIDNNQAEINIIQNFECELNKLRESPEVFETLSKNVFLTAKKYFSNQTFTEQYQLLFTTL